MDRCKILFCMCPASLLKPMFLSPQRPRAQMSWANKVCGHRCRWAQVSVGTGVSGPGVGGHKWAQVSVGTSVGGHKYRWAQGLVGTSVERAHMSAGTNVASL